MSFNFGNTTTPALGSTSTPAKRKYKADKMDFRVMPL